jgi:2-(1,2-epoxy-1,2-dihydrophenyl)acetyl-CoA isomerase
MNKPERKNPLGPEMVNELCWALSDAKDDPEVRVVVITGAGKAFSAGGDLKQMSGGGDAASEPLPQKGEYVDLLLAQTQLGKPTIARIPGVAMGGAWAWSPHATSRSPVRARPSARPRSSGACSR